MVTRGVAIIPWILVYILTKIWIGVPTITQKTVTTNKTVATIFSERN